MVPHLRPRAALVILATSLALPSALWGQASAAVVTLAQFRQLNWLSGKWRGSGGNYPAFYEEYRAVNDSTIRMRSCSDSTFASATDSSVIELRNGSIRSHGSGAVSVAVEVQPTRVHFARPGTTNGGYTFSRVSADEWTATLHPSTAGGRATTYTMRRARR